MQIDKVKALLNILDNGEEFPLKLKLVTKECYESLPSEELLSQLDKLNYFNDREATLFRDELGSNARYHELLQKKLAAEDAHRKMVGEAAWKQYLQLDEICNELESIRYQAMYLAGAADFEKLFRQS